MMDSKVEEKMVRQIEKNLSNQIVDNLFITGQVYENKASSNPLEHDDTLSETRGHDSGNEKTEDYVESGQTPYLSRAEYIRQAREACLRQLNSLPQDKRIADIETMSEMISSTSAKPIMRDYPIYSGANEANSLNETASFRSLIIRTICCAVIFLSIFMIDKLKLKWGDFTYEKIREFVVQKDHLMELEEWIVSWLK